MKRLILAGAGHAHAQVLKDWITQPVPGTELLVVSPSPLAPYSGMVPGWMAGRYAFDEICIDFAALCRAAGARFLTDECSRLDADQNRLVLHSGAALDYDRLSLNIGSTLRPPVAPAGSGVQVLSLRPLGELRAAWEGLLATLVQQPPQQPPQQPTQQPPQQPPQQPAQHRPLRRLLRITAVGGGAAGIEALLAVCARLAALQPAWKLQPTLISRSPTLLPGMGRGAAERAAAALHRAGAALRLNSAFDAHSLAETDVLLWATGAQAHAWPGRSGLAVNPQGFVCIDAQLRSVSHPNVFAVGDCADWTGTGAGTAPAAAGATADSNPALPKAGVFAVRMGPVLSHNLRASLQGTALLPHRPRRRYLALLATADGSAVAAWSGLAAQGPWVWRWKDRIDRRFLARFHTPAAADPHPTTP